MARRKKMTITRQRKMIDAIEDGNTISYACEIVGVSRQTEYMFRRENPEYSQLVEDALDTRNEMVEDALYATALGGNFQAQRFFLINRDNKNWKSEHYVKLSGDSEGDPIDIAIREVIIEHPPESAESFLDDQPDRDEIETETEEATPVSDL